MKANQDRDNYVNRCLPYTMTQAPRLQVLWNCVELIHKYDLSGSLVEAGVYKGGSAMLMAYAIKHFGRDNKIILLDTFTGMPKPTDKDFKINSIKKPRYIEKWERNQNEDYNEWNYCPIEGVAKNMRKTGYDNLVFLEGKVEYTIPDKGIKDIAILRIDTDFYESTRHILNCLFPLVQDKGFVILDDYYCWNGAKLAVDEYFKEHKLNQKEIVPVDHSCAIYQKGGQVLW